MAKVQSYLLMLSSFSQNGPTVMCMNMSLSTLVSSKRKAALVFLDEMRLYGMHWLYASWPDSHWIKEVAVLSKDQDGSTDKLVKLLSFVWQKLAGYLGQANFNCCLSLIFTFDWSFAHSYFRQPKEGEGGCFERKILKASYFRANNLLAT